MTSYEVPEPAIVYGTGYEAIDVHIDAGQHDELTPALERLLELDLASESIETIAPSAVTADPKES